MAAATPSMISPPSGSDAPARRVTVVLGMHRSGTSAVAGCLQRLGVDLGPRLMPATEDNPRGYYEHIDLVNLHDRLLLALGRAWDDTFPFPPDWWRDDALIGRYRDEALGLLRRDFPTAALWGLKDPRLCRLLPWWEGLWREAGSAPLFLLVCRPPGEVAASLAKREGFSPAKSALLWLQHTLEAERHTRGQPRVLIDFKAFLADWRGALEPAARVLGMPWPVTGNGANGGTFVDPALARSTVSAAVPDSLPRWVEETHAALRLGLSGREEAMCAELDRVAGHLHAAESLFAPTPVQNASDLAHQLAAARSQAVWYETEWYKARLRTDDARAKLQAKRQEIERLKKQGKQ